MGEHRGEVRGVALRHGDALRLAAPHDGVAGGFQPGDQFGAERRVAERRLGVGTALQLQLVGVQHFLVMSLLYSKKAPIRGDSASQDPRAALRRVGDCAG